jgi:hypothetical protein
MNKILFLFLKEREWVRRINPARNDIVDIINAINSTFARQSTKLFISAYGVLECTTHRSGST